MAVQRTRTTAEAARGEGQGRNLVYRAMVGLVTVAGLACGGLADEGKLPPDVQDPDRLKTTSGALARYQAAMAVFPGAFDRVMTETGILTDELNDIPAPLTVSGPWEGIDARYDLTGFATSYSLLHHVRGEAREARGYLLAYAPDSLAALAGHLLAAEGYADVLLADVFCSGIPLSTVDFNGDYTLAAGSSTREVYERAVALFDSALALTADSARLQQFAALGKGRALLALGRYTEATAAVAAVPVGYTYQVVFTPTSVVPRLLAVFWSDLKFGYQVRAGVPRVGDNEGGNGLDYRSSNDPRVLVISGGTDVLGNNIMFFPSQYPPSGMVTLTVASGIEAQLIEAEAALQMNDAAWLTRLNALRTDGTQNGSGVYNPGTGGVAGLAPLADPDPAAPPGPTRPRVDLLFRERAFWLYLTGHRQGDLRRLIREYGRLPTTVYPTGSYQGGPGAYGTAIVAPVPEEERANNLQYTGCIDSGA